MFCHLMDARYLLFHRNIKALVWQRPLVTPSRQVGRQGAYKHNWWIYVLSHTLHLLMDWLSQNLCERLS